MTTVLPGKKVLKAGVFGDPEVLEAGKPAMEIWTKNRVPWVRPIEGARQFEEWPGL